MDEQIVVRLPADLVRRLDAYAAEFDVRTRSSVVEAALRGVLRPSVPVVRGAAASGMDRFDELVVTAPPEMGQAAADVGDTLLIAREACRTVFGLPISQSLVLEVALAMLSRWDGVREPAAARRSASPARSATATGEEHEHR
jgi:hypothetical protein